MAHDKIFGICENKCLVETDTKANTDAVAARVGTLETTVEEITNLFEVDENQNVTFPAGVTVNGGFSAEINTLTVPYNTDKYVLAICKQVDFTKSYGGRDWSTTTVNDTCIVSDLYEYTTDFFKISDDSPIDVNISISPNNATHEVINLVIKVNGMTKYTVTGSATHTLNLNPTDVINVSGTINHNNGLGSTSTIIKISTSIFGV